MSETRTYNNDNTLASISFSGAAIGNLTYGWDDNKNKTSEAISGTMSGYGFDVGTSGYDDEDRLVNWERADSALDQSWDLSLVGDWDSIAENSATQNRTHGPTHELLTVASQSVTHDLKGNITSIPAVLRPGTDPPAMAWDFDNRLVSADVDNDSTADVFYKWDALGRRVYRDDGTTAQVFVQSGQQTIADYTATTAANSPTYTYVYASYIDEPVMRGGSGGLRYYHRNQQYSITALTDGSGTITERYAYSAYGTPTITDAAGTTRTSSADHNRYAYTGRENDEALGLYHYRARMYDSVAGRFCSRDPIGYEGSPWNLFEYVGGQPTVGLDPSGLGGIYDNCFLKCTDAFRGVNGELTAANMAACQLFCGLVSKCKIKQDNCYTVMVRACGAGRRCAQVAVALCNALFPKYATAFQDRRTIMARLTFSSPKHFLEQFCTETFESWPQSSDVKLLSAREDDTVRNGNPNLIVICPLNPEDQDVTQLGPFIQKYEWGLQIDLWGSSEEKLVYCVSSFPESEYAFDFGDLKLRYRIRRLSNVTEMVHLATVDVWQQGELSY